MFLVLLIPAGMTLLNPALLNTFPDGEIEGIWQGTLKVSGMELRIIITVTRSSDNTLTATYDVPEQNVAGVPIDEITFDNRKLSLPCTPMK